jgi:hypothetical protein
VPPGKTKFPLKNNIKSLFDVIAFSSGTIASSGHIEKCPERSPKNQHSISGSVPSAFGPICRHWRHQNRSAGRLADGYGFEKIGSAGD